MLKRTIALTYGLLGYLFFLGVFSYAIGFIGNFGVSKTIDSGSQAPIGVALAVNLSLLSLFAIQHSVMARQGFKRQWTRLVPAEVERTTFVVAASAVLALLIWQWQPMPNVVWDLSGTAAAPALQILFWAGWGLLLLSTFLLNHFELFGLAQVWAYFFYRERHRPTFKVPALYRMVRHPLYLGFVIAFWAAPKMSAGRLLFAIACTGYILVGIYFEERDLIASYGYAYLEYCRRVPMLIPFLKRQKVSRRVTGKAA